MEHIDLIREAKELPHPARSKIGNRQPVTSGGSADDDESESNSDYSEGFAEERPTYTKLEEIDLLSSIGRDIGVDLEKYAQPVPDVVAMESIESLRGQPRPNSVIKDHVEDTNKLLDRELPEASSADARKKEKMARNQAKRRQQQQQQQQHLQQHQHSRANSHRRPDKRRADIENGPGRYFDQILCHSTFTRLTLLCFIVFISSMSTQLSLLLMLVKKQHIVDAMKSSPMCKSVNFTGVGWGWLDNICYFILNRYYI